MFKKNFFICLFIFFCANNFISHNYAEISNHSKYSADLSPESKTFVDSASIKTYIFNTAKLGDFYFPIKGKLISHYGKRGHQWHSGTDVKLQKGDTVRAGFGGIVTKAARHYGYGLLVVISHGFGIETYYAHLSKCIVQEGDSIKAGDAVGLGGRTGWATTTHLHFEIRYNSKAYNPEQLFDFTNQKVLSQTYYESEKLETKDEPVLASIKTDSVEKVHVIKKGDTLYSLAKKYNTSVDKLQDENNLKPGSKLKIGNKLRVN
jgi:murein DD-endopeptidase MepM/ murein hydrolase activator NlpD